GIRSCDHQVNAAMIEFLPEPDLVFGHRVAVIGRADPEKDKGTDTIDPCRRKLGIRTGPHQQKNSARHGEYGGNNMGVEIYRFPDLSHSLIFLVRRIRLPW